MSIKTRLDKLEKRQNGGVIEKLVELIFVLDDDTEEQAVERWKANNPDKPEPDNIIFIVPFGYEREKSKAA